MDAGENPVNYILYGSFGRENFWLFVSWISRLKSRTGALDKAFGDTIIFRPELFVRSSTLSQRFLASVWIACPPHFAYSY
jgi:hypothetical protein